MVQTCGLEKLDKGVKVKLWIFPTFSEAKQS